MKSQFFSYVFNSELGLNGCLFSTAEIYLDSLDGPFLIPGDFYTVLASFLDIIELNEIGEYIYFFSKA